MQPTIAELQAQIRELLEIRDSQAQEIDRLRAEIRELRRRLGEPADENEGALKGLRLAVIGPSFREHSYRQVLEPLGCRLLFASSEDKLGLVEKTCAKAHGIIFITTYTSHKVDTIAAATAERTGIPFVRLPFKGLERLRQVALDIADDMRAYKDLLEECKKQKAASK